jgi:pimeloyl-ACP methyl ester carboxylesterase
VRGGFDPRGHGRSGGPRGSYTIPELLADLRAAVAFARSRFGDPIAVAGSSQGGIVSFYLAAAGDPVASVICHNVADLGDPESVRLTRYPGVSRILKPLVLSAARLFPEVRVPLSLYLDLDAEPVRFLGTAKAVASQAPLFVPYIRLKGLASLASCPLPRPVEEIRTPVMILHGERDTIFPSIYVEGIYRRLTCRKRLQVHPGLPHYLIVDYLAEILPGVLQWLEETCAVGTS